MSFGTFDGIQLPGHEIYRHKKQKQKQKSKKKGSTMPRPPTQPLLLPLKAFYNFFTAQQLFSMPFPQRISYLLTHDRDDVEPNRKSTIHAFHTLAKTEIFTLNRDSIYRDYLMELRLRRLFKMLLYHWRMKRLIRNSRESEPLDPITFMPIENPDYVYDLKKNRRFTFEASTLSISIRRNLYAQLYAVPQPKRPINIITNRAFTNMQLISIHEQLKMYPIRIEDLGVFRRLDLSIERWKLYMFPYLQNEAYREELYDYQSETGHDLLHDYIMDSMYTLNYQPTEAFKIMLFKIIGWWPGHSILEVLRHLCLKSYEADYFNLHAKGLLLLKTKIAIDALWPNSMLLKQGLARQNALSNPTGH